MMGGEPSIFALLVLLSRQATPLALAMPRLLSLQLTSLAMLRHDTARLKVGFGSMTSIPFMSMFGFMELGVWC